MLHRIQLADFKAFADPQVAHLAPLTLIYGPNSGGKSSVLQSLLFLQQSTFAARPVFRGGQVDLGSFESAVHGHRQDRLIVVGVGFSSQPSDSNPSDLEIDSLQNVNVSFAGGDDVAVSGVQYGLGDPTEIVEMVRQPPDASPQGATRGNGHFKFASQDSAVALGKLIASWQDPQDGERLDQRVLHAYLTHKGFGTGDSRVDHLLPAEIDNPWDEYLLLQTLMGSELLDEPPRLPRRLPGLFMLRELVRNFEDTLKGVIHLGALRARPERRYEGFDWKAQDSTGLSSLSTLWRDKLSERVIKRVNDWLAQSGVRYTMDVRRVRDIVAGDSGVVVARDGSLELALTDVGFGISQVLPLLTAAATESGTILVEQPEIHLHPRMQGHVADVMLESAGLFRNRQTLSIDWQPTPQWIVETHSEAICARVQRRIREGAVSSDDVSIIYVQPTGEGSLILQLKLDDHGNFIDEWPDGFFDETFKDFMA